MLLRRFTASCTLAFLVLIDAPPVRARSIAELAPTPPMGWNSWNWFGKANINEKVVEETIDAMVATGLRDAGYVYVVVDGGWRDTHLGPNGELLPHPVKFPGGMKRLADYAHAHGLKFGVHTVPGSHDCGGDAVGGYGHEEVQLQQFVDWGFDFIKLDKCRLNSGWTEDKVRTVYTKWSDLLTRTPRPIVFSISAYVFRDWYPGMCNMARTTGDIAAHIHKTGAIFDDGDTRRSYISVMQCAEINNRSAAAAGHGFWNDAEMLVVGQQGLTAEEQEAHFALWCVMSAPLMLGNDPRHMTAAEKALVLNRECIAVDQDPTEQGRRVHTEGKTEIWAKKLAGNRTAVIILNRDANAAKDITLKPEDVGLTGKWKARDLFAQQDLGPIEGSWTKSTPAHGCHFLLLSR